MVGDHDAVVDDDDDDDEDMLVGDDDDDEYPQRLVAALLVWRKGLADLFFYTTCVHNAGLKLHAFINACDLGRKIV